MDKNLEVLKKLYLVPNEFQIWAWVLTTLAILFLFKGTRRLAGTWFLIALGCMALFFGLSKAMSDFAPKEVAPEDLKPKPGARRRHH